MSVLIDIHPSSHTLDMYGDPATSSAYSLSGHVSISLGSPYSLFGSRRAARLLLQSLIITFEGQSEVVTQEFGYAPLRLCSLDCDLAPSEPIELTNEGHEDSDKPCTWNALFNLVIPGWLPATAAFGDSLEEDAGTRYALFATAKFVTLDDNNDKTWSLSTFCSMFSPRTRAVHAPKCAVTLRRFMNRPPVPFSTKSLFPMSNYATYATPEYIDDTQDLPSIPLDILSKIQIIASVPEYVSTDDDSVPFVIRLRTTDLADAECKRLRVTNFCIDVKQSEKYRGLPFSDYASCYPIPSSSEQPPNKPLLAPHSFHSLYDTGLVTASISPDQIVTRSFSVMHPAQSGDYQLAGDGYIFDIDHYSREAPTWYTINTSVPLAEPNTPSRALRVSGTSPLFAVRHEVHVALTCMYDFPENSEPVTERLHFSVPVNFVHIMPAPLSRSVSPSPYLGTSDPSSSIEPVPQAEMLTCGMSYPHCLPAYSQLFDSNGDRQIDYSIPLPVYTAHTPPSADHLELDAAGGAGKSIFFIANGSP